MEKLDRKYSKIYSRDAPKYDKKRFLNHKGKFSKEFKNELILNIIDEYKLRGRDCSIVDVASGTGRVAHELVKKSFKHIIALDLTHNMLKVNQQNLKPEFRKKITFLQANMKAMPFNEHKFDAVIIASFFYLIPIIEYNKYIRDIHRILKPGGFLICEIANAFHIFNPKRLVEVNFYKHIRKQSVKSYLYPWNLKNLFSNFSLQEVRGICFPFILKKISPHLPFYFSTNYLFKYFGGQFIVVYKKI